MKTSTTITGAKAFSQRLIRFSADLGRETESVLKQAARATAVELGAATMPLGLSDDTADKFRRRIEGDVRRVFASRQRPTQIYAILKISHPELAAGYWHAFKSQKPRRMANILARAGLPQGVNPAAHQAARTDAYGRVPKNQKPVSIATESSVNAYVQKQRRKAGLAKAGWYAAAKGLGGRVRRNLRDEDGGNRKTEEIFPGYIRALARRYPGLGGARIINSGGVVQVEIWTAVRYATDALPQNLQDKAIEDARTRVYQALNESLARLNDKYFGNSSTPLAA